jgi:hypothetical protein
MNLDHKTALLFVILWSTVVACSQAAAPVTVTLPGELRDHVKDERFQIVTSIRGMPIGVRSALQTLFFSEVLDIAEIGGEFQASGTPPNSKLPIRRMAAAGCSYDHCLVYYELGGSAQSWRVALFHWTPEETKFDWGGTAPGGLKTIDEIRSAILSGKISDSAGVW